MTSLIAQGEDADLGRGLVLVDVTPTIEPEGAAEISAFMRSGADGFATLEDAAAAVVAYNPNRARPPRPEGLRKNLRELDGRWYWHWDPRLLSRTDGDDATGTPTDADVEQLGTRARAAARAITVPALLVRGARSKIVSPAGAREFLELIPTARRIDVAGTGHMVAGDDNDVFGAGLLDFLDHSVLTGD
jgi:pimeloyl-ACP methyl ester carboxylesterase